jgi:hypothetical protein
LRDANGQLEQAYYAILKDNVSFSYTGGATVNVPTYNTFVPAGFPPFYIIIQNLSSIGIETKNDQSREVSIQFLICTRLEANSGWELNKIADKLLELCYPERGSVINGCLSMDLVSDVNINDVDDSGRLQIRERALTFKHIISN